MTINPQPKPATSLTSVYVSRHIDLWTPPPPSLLLPPSREPTRLDVFRLLVKREPNGLPAATLREELVVPQHHVVSILAILTLVGSSRRNGIAVRSCTALDLATLRSMTLFLLQDCCGGEPALCASLIELIQPCCPPQKEKCHGNAKARSRV